jgi:hypothetical protein
MRNGEPNVLRGGSGGQVNAIQRDSIATDSHSTLGSIGKTKPNELRPGCCVRVRATELSLEPFLVVMSMEMTTKG